jgi:hypothetical protein
MQKVFLNDRRHLATLEIEMIRFSLKNDTEHFLIFRPAVTSAT